MLQFTLRRTALVPVLASCLLFPQLLDAQNGRQELPTHVSNGVAVQPRLHMSTMQPMNGGALQMLRGGAPPNDLCADAVVSALAANTTVTVTGNSTNATDDQGYGAPTVWEAFTIIECMDVTIDLCGTTPAFANSFINLQVDCPLNNLATATEANTTTCPDGNPTVVFPNLAPGTYHFPVIGEPGSVGPYTLNFTGVPCATPTPPGNDCVTAISVTPSTSCTPVTYSSDGSQDSGTPNTCSGDASDDLWFSFMAMATEHTVIADPSGGYDGVIELFSGTCGGLVSIQCEDVAFLGSPEIMSIVGLTIGETYFFRVYDWYAGQSPTPSVDVCVIMDGGTGPANDLCSNVTVDPLVPGSPLSYLGTTVDATTGLDAEAASALDDGIPKVWHAFSLADCATVTVEYCGTVPSFDEVYAALATTCPASNAVVISQDIDFSCTDTNAVVIFNYLTPGTYYVPVGMFGPGTMGDYALSISAVACPPVPANNDCATADSLMIHLPADCPAEATAGNNASADQDAGDPSCDGTTGIYRDVWYAFNSYSNTEVVVNFDRGNMTDWAVVVYEGCGGAEVACEIGSLDPLIVPTDPNTDYVVRIYSNTQYGNGGDFTICLTGNFPTAIPGMNTSTWSVHPNPSQGTLYVRSTVGMNALVELIDATGRVVYTERAQLIKGQDHRLALSKRMSEGMYTLRITDGDQRTEQRVVIR